jgi:site-specific DNA recombinase
MPVAIYARVSTKRQAENDLSIPDQLQQMKDWCEKNGHVVANEYIEAGASAKNDKRPVFQQMITNATLNPPPYNAIIVHSLSRFFRDSVDLALYERRLNAKGIKLISITQQTSEDSAGEMARKFFSIFDEYQSKENSKHTLRAMKENARQGFFNGAHAPFGYKTVATEHIGNRGRKKKKLVIDKSEADIVQFIYQLYLDGYHGASMGMKSIAVYLNEKGYTMRGSEWRAQKVNEILSSPTYIGQFYFNKRDQNKKLKPEEEWVCTTIAPIIERKLYEKVEIKRIGHQPKNSKPRLISSPIFLSGLLICGECGSGMTLMTGKSGQYRYYKCTTKKHKGSHLCSTPNIPMDKLDDLVRKQLSERVFNPKRVGNLIQSLRQHIKAHEYGDNSALFALQRSVKDSEKALDRLYKGVETGVIEVDETLKNRIKILKNKRDGILMRVSELERKKSLPIGKITQNQITAFSNALKSRFKDPNSDFGKGYLKFLISEIRVEKKQLIVKGSKRALAEVVSSLNPENTATTVPSSILDWRSRKDSNLRPPSS